MNAWCVLWSSAADTNPAGDVRGGLVESSVERRFGQPGRHHDDTAIVIAARDRRSVFVCVLDADRITSRLMERVPSGSFRGGTASGTGDAGSGTGDGMPMAAAAAAPSNMRATDDEGGGVVKRRGEVDTVGGLADPALLIPDGDDRRSGGAHAPCALQKGHPVRYRLEGVLHLTGIRPRTLPKRPTIDLAEQRNRFACAISDAVLILHASPGGKLERLAEELLASGKRVWTLEDPANLELARRGARVVPAEKASVLWTP